MRIAVFAGSFDPFTIGHSDIVTRALGMFDKVVIAVGYNEHKVGWMPIDERTDSIRKIFHNNPRIIVDSYSCLTADYAQRYKTEEDTVCLLRGVRSVKDFEYEREIAEVNLKISGIETVLLFANPSLTAVSSSVVRELAHFGHDVSQWLPK